MRPADPPCCGVGRGARASPADPLVAIADALAVVRPAELFVGTLPAGHSHWLEKGLLDRVRERFALPVTHVAGEYGLHESLV